jgi:NDP-sugar pyrophosphorylase family protein
MIAMILAAGFGTRLRPLTIEKSKVALSLAGVPVLVRVIRLLRGAGIERFVVNLHHAPDSVREVLAEWGEDVRFSYEAEILGTGGALFGARELLGGERVLLVNGDCYYGGPDFLAALEFHERMQSIATMVLIGMPAGESYRGVEIDSGGRLVRIAGRPESGPPPGEQLHFPGIHILEPEFYTGIGPGFSDINRDRYPELIAAGAPVFGWRSSFPWHDMGTPGRFLAAAFGLLGEYPDGVLIGPGCEIAPSAELIGPLELGPGCRIGEHCRVERSVLGRGVVLEAGAIVSDSLLGDGITVSPAAVLQGTAAALAAGEIQLAHWKL